MKKRLGVALSALFLTMLACRPIFTIGWEESLVLIALIGFLIGPPIYRFFRWLEKVRGRKEK